MRNYDRMYCNIELLHVRKIWLGFLHVQCEESLDLINQTILTFENINDFLLWIGT